MLKSPIYHELSSKKSNAEKQEYTTVLSMTMENLRGIQKIRQENCDASLSTSEYMHQGLSRITSLYEIFGINSFHLQSRDPCGPVHEHN